MLEILNNKKIKGYRIEGDKIIVKTGLFSSKVISNTKENIEYLNQRLSNDHKTFKYNENDQKASKIGLGSVALSCLTVGFSILTIATGALPALIATNVFLLGSLYTCYKHEDKSNDLERYDNVEFLYEDKNKELFNEEINNSKSEEEIDKKLSGADYKTTNTVYREKSITDEDIFNINSVNFMTLKGLKKIKENLLNLKKSIEPEEVINEDGPKLTLENKND